MASRLPDSLKKLFWDYDFKDITWEKDRDLIISRILSYGSYKDIKWLVRKLGTDELRCWITVRKGRGLDARQLRFWELVLDLPHEQVNTWLEDRDWVWDRRVHR